MKLIFITIFFVAFSTSSAIAKEGFDGCYQLYRPSALYPVICLEGTTEEGIGGSGTRFVVIGPNSNEIIHCSKASSLEMTSNSYAYYLGSKKEFSMENVTVKNGSMEGDAIFGATRLNFVELSRATAESFIEKARADRKCISAGW